ncbi:MAG: TolC family protein [Steroidobacteraceae bacterium]
MIFPFARKFVACFASYALWCACVLTAAPALAASEPVGELSLRHAIDAALTHNPDLTVSSYELKVAEARVTQAGLRPNPQASVEFENFIGTGETSGIKSLETTLSLSQTIELGGKRGFRVSTAALGGELTGVVRQAQQLDVLAEVTRRFIDVVSAQQAVSLAQRATGLTEQSLAAITARVAAARTPLAEQSRATIAVTRARIEQQQAEKTLQGKRRALAALWGGRTAAFSSASAELFTLPTVQPFETLSARLQGNPDFLRFATEARLRDAEWRLAQSQAKPNLNVGIGIRRFEATDDAALVAGFSIDLPVFNRNQGVIREAEVRREQLRVQSQAALIRAEATLFGLYQELLSARASVETLRTDAIPQAEAALLQTQDGYERGRFSYLELAAAQQELLGLQGTAIEAAADYHRFLAEIERLTNLALTHDSLEATQP